MKVVYLEISADIPQLGLSFAFDSVEGGSQPQLHALHIFNDGKKCYLDSINHHISVVNQYRYSPLVKLPRNIDIKMRIRQLVESLGEPCEKHGGRTAITLVWKNIFCSENGEPVILQAEFSGLFWEDQENELMSLTFIRPNQSR